MILAVAGAYFLLPLYAALRFADVKAYGSVFSQAGFTDALWLSVRLAIMTTVITLALMVPTTVLCTCGCPGCGGCWRASRSSRSSSRRWC